MKVLATAVKTIGAFLLVFALSNCQKSAVDQPALTADAHAGPVSKKEKTYQANLSSLNNSGVSGMATVTISDGMVTVQVEASGLEANQVHPQHIHGFEDNNRKSTCPTMMDDVNGDGVVDLGEGLPSYGPVLLSLGAPTATANGTISYTQTFSLGENASVLPLQNRAIVLHGLTVNGQYWPVLPVACGQLRSMNGNGQ